MLNSKKDELTPAQLTYVREASEWEGKNHKDLLSIIKEVKPHVLIGTSTVPGAFTEEVVREMAKHVERPVIFPLSNPTKLHEAKPQDLYDWTDGKVLTATGSPFPPVKHNGKEYEVCKSHLPPSPPQKLTSPTAECNNSVTFPGIGLGAILSRTRLLPPSLLVAAVKALASTAPTVKGTGAALLPDVTEVREVSVQIAKNVIKAAVTENLNQEQDIPKDDQDLEEWIRDQMWDARYRPLKLVETKGASTLAKGEAGTSTGRRAAKL